MGERNNGRYSTKTAKFGNDHIMVWCCIKTNGRRKLLKVYVNLNCDNYISLLWWSNLLTNDEDGEIFQHDCVPCLKGFLWMKMFNFWKTGEHKVLISI